jgi:hypothetical protein
MAPPNKRLKLAGGNPARPAHTSAGRCVFKELGEASDGQRLPETSPLAPPLAPRSLSLVGRLLRGWGWILCCQDDRAHARPR